MNREEYFEYHEQLTKRMTKITRAKNADYTGATGDDPFSNFSRVSDLGVCSTEQGFMVRILDKYMRINSFVQLGSLQVKDESVEDTLLDLANYCLLFLGYLKSQKSTKPEIVGQFQCDLCNAYFILLHRHPRFNENEDGKPFYEFCPDCVPKFDTSVKNKRSQPLP